MNCETKVQAKVLIIPPSWSGAQMCFQNSLPNLNAKKLRIFLGRFSNNFLKTGSPLAITVTPPLLEERRDFHPEPP